MFKANRNHVNTTRLDVIHLPKVFLTFFLVTLAWIFFRADTVGIAWSYLTHIFDMSDGSVSLFYKTSKSMLFTLIIVFSIIVMMIFEFITVQKEQKEVKLNSLTSLLVILLIIFMGVFKNPSDFIYFQF